MCCSDGWGLTGLVNDESNPDRVKMIELAATMSKNSTDMSSVLPRESGHSRTILSESWAQVAQMTNNFIDTYLQ